MRTKKTQKATTSAAITVITALALVAISQALAPSSFANDTTRTRRDLTFVAKPYDVTKNYMIFEVGFKRQVAGHIDYSDVSNNMLVTELGVMHNMNEKTSFGAALYGSVSDRYSAIGIKPRIRHWLSRSRGVDFSAGILLSVSDGSGYSRSYRSPGFVSSLSVDLFRSLSVDVTFESIQKQVFTDFDPTSGKYATDSKAQNSLYLGVSGKDYAAVAGVGATAVAVLIALATWDGGSWGYGSSSW